MRLNRPQRHKAHLIYCRSTNSVWVRQCGATKGRLCPNHTETELHGGQSTSTKVHNDDPHHDPSYNQNIFPSFVILYHSKYVKRALLFIKTYFPNNYLFTVSLYSLYFSLRGLITCGQCPCCLSRTSPITSVSPCL